MKFVNLTPHPIVLRATDGRDTVIAPSGQVARVVQYPSGTMHLSNFPVPIVTPPHFGPVEGLPEPEGGVAYIVAGLVLAHVPRDRGDVFAPATGPNDGAVRDDAGRIIAVTRLVAAGL